MSEMPVIYINDAITAIDLHHWSNEYYCVIANVLDIRAVIHGQPVCEFHQRRRGAGFGGVNCSGDVVNGERVCDELVCFVIIEIDSPRIGQLRQSVPILLELCE